GPSSRIDDEIVVRIFGCFPRNQEACQIGKVCIAITEVLPHEQSRAKRGVEYLKIKACLQNPPREIKIWAFTKVVAISLECNANHQNSCARIEPSSAMLEEKVFVSLVGLQQRVDNESIDACLSGNVLQSPNVFGQA